MFNPEKITLSVITELVSKIQILSGSEDITKNQEQPPKFCGKWFCPLHVQGVVNTFPPVWNFKPEKYLLRNNDATHHELFLVGKIMDKGRLEYYLGPVTAKRAFDQSPTVTEIITVLKGI